jgi:hypothetical protein
MTHAFLAAACSALILTLVPPTAAAQRDAPSAPSMPPRIGPAVFDSALAGIAAAIRESYVFPEKRAGIVERLERSHRAGRYRVEDPRVFAQRVTEDLSAASHDGHLYLLYDPDQYAAARGGGRAAAEPEELEAYWRRLAIREHHGLTEMRLLPGNLRYLKVGAFHWVRDETGAAYDAAMRFLGGADAAIIDLRGNGGGSHGAVQYLVSHFLGGDTLEMTFLRGDGSSSQSRTLEHLPAGRLTGKPLYVLIDGGTASAGEAFAYDVQQFKLGELVGTRTAGGANNNKLVPIAPSFMLSVSYGRPVHPVSDTNWEGTGVEPSVPAAPEQALEVAEALALSRLARTPGATPQDLADWAWARIGVEARRHPVSMSPAWLKARAGRYGEEVEVTFRDGALWLARKDRPTRRLSPLTRDGLFGVEGSSMLRVRFTAGERLEMLRKDDPSPRRLERE